MSTLFNPGAPAPKGFIPLSVPEIRGNEWKYVKECLDTSWVSSGGAFVDRFEQEFARYLEAPHAVSVVNGTAALHVALLVAGVGPEDEVLIPALTFIAPANAIRYTGAWPVFIDVEMDYWQLDPQKVIDFLALECQWANGELRNKSTGRPVKAILPVHILGHPVDMDPIIDVARKYNLRIVEDATESLGSKYKGRTVGCLGDIACFSFNGNKVITTGGGGMIVTGDEGSAGEAKHLTTQAKLDPVEYVHDRVGYNYRLTNVQAAMGCAQLEQLDDYIAQKKRSAAAYSEMLAGIDGLSCMREAPWASSTAWLFSVMVDDQKFGMDSRELMKFLEKRGIQSRPLWQPLNQSPAHATSQSYHVTAANIINRNVLSLPSSVGLTAEEIEIVVSGITDAKHGRAWKL